MSEAAQAVQKAVDEMKANTSEGTVEKKKRVRKPAAKKTPKPKAAKAPKEKKERQPKGEAAFININVGKDIKNRLAKAKKDSGKSLNEIVRAALDKAL